MLKDTKNKHNIAVIGSGYVGYSIGLALSTFNIVTLVDTSTSVVKKINKGISPIKDKDAEHFRLNNSCNLSAIESKDIDFSFFDIFIISVPTDIDISGNLDTKTVESVIKRIMLENKEAPIIIKSTVPIGFSDLQNKKFKTERILFSPEFLREGFALYDNLYPSRIILGGSYKDKNILLDILKGISKNTNTDVICMTNKEAECVKLFSNSYLAMRIAFFNELDSFAIEKKIDPKAIIKGISSDKRIGNYYNNPSFGFGGYCLPKDTSQLSNEYVNAPNPLIKSILTSNSHRLEFISKIILDFNPTCLGIFRLTAKNNSNSMRSAANKEIINHVKDKVKDILIYEPFLDNEEYEGIKVVDDLTYFKKNTDLIIANRNHPSLDDVASKIFTRDIYREN